MKSFILALIAVLSLAASPLPRSTPEQQGIPSSSILSFIETVDRIDSMNSFMLLRHGHVVAEGWWAPYTPQTPVTLYSLSKSFTSTAAGLAIGEGKLNVDDPILKFFPDDAPILPSDNLKSMLVKDLLRMNTGHATEPARPPGGNWVKSFLNHPVPNKPGSKFLYNTSATYMIAAIVEKVTAEHLLDYLRPRLFDPLGIENPTWEKSSQGIATGGYGLSIRTEDIAKFGQLYLQKGKWQDKQLIPESWVLAATSKQTDNGGSNPRSDWNQGYGYQFWRSRHGAFRGDGAFGQYCIVMPKEDAVIVITSGVKNMQGILDIVWEKLLPALQSDKPLPADEVAHHKLQSTLKALSVKPQQGEAKPLASVFNKPFTFPVNEYKLEAITLIKNDNVEDTLAVIKMDGTERRILCGKNAWRDGRASWRVFNDKPVAVSAAWTADDTFAIKSCFYESPHILTLTLKFSGEQLTLTPEWNVTFGPTKGAVLTGKALP
jgi:CubicO group peptidase (beta-lactamase class C family)